MRNLTVLIKPASGLCNLSCTYCFYRDELENRSENSCSFMSTATARALIEKALDFAQEQCTFIFQGGEPTLAGLDFFRFFVDCAKAENKKGIEILYSMQTNGQIIDDNWAQFFKENNFLVGLSLDGDKQLHEKHRGAGSYARVMNAAKLLKRYEIPFNILCVVTAAVAKKPERVYGFFKKQGFSYLQFIPCLDPIGRRGGEDYSLSAHEYGIFLKKLFDLWYADTVSGVSVSVRWFDSLVGMLLGKMPESCGMLGRCSVQYTVEADGTVYPCDFYVLDEYRLGSINTDSFLQLDKKRGELKFIESSAVQELECRACRYFTLCRGGCRRDRDGFDGKTIGMSVWCESYRMLFDYALPRMLTLAQNAKECGR